MPVVNTASADPILELSFGDQSLVLRAPSPAQNLRKRPRLNNDSFLVGYNSRKCSETL
ncbi:conserved hypothetical protein [Ricinus communis]|uniref:Uncharacterized protein n=1 Tax=Ricinus communis TaxID=3988 RepID=B9SK75_RICCO|nr:conserved hypothetical protein [Ricinus communis]